MQVVHKKKIFKPFIYISLCKSNIPLGRGYTYICGLYLKNVEFPHPKNTWCNSSGEEYVQAFMSTFHSWMRIRGHRDGCRMRSGKCLPFRWTWKTTDGQRTLHPYHRLSWPSDRWPKILCTSCSTSVV